MRVGEIMSSTEIIKIIEKRFDETGNPAQIPLLKSNRTFMATLADDGIYVSNLANQPFSSMGCFY